MKMLIQVLLISLTLLGVSSVLAASPYYWVDGAGQVVRDGSGNCVVATAHGKDFPVCRGEMIAQAPTAPTAPAAPVAPRDSDRDGVADGTDECPGTPRGVRVDAKGCPMDTDRDGVPDYLDKCIETPLGSTVDARGCPERIVVKELNFATGSAALTPESRTILKSAAAGIKVNPALKEITVTGHTDSQGAAAYNKSLSERRARSVADYLRDQGLSNLKINVVGMGEDNPIATNDTPEGRAENRRVEIDLK